MTLFSNQKVADLAGAKNSTFDRFQGLGELVSKGELPANSNKILSEIRRGFSSALRSFDIKIPFFQQRKVLVAVNNGINNVARAWDNEIIEYHKDFGDLSLIDLKSALKPRTDLSGRPATSQFEALIASVDNHQNICGDDLILLKKLSEKNPVIKAELYRFGPADRRDDGAQPRGFHYTETTEQAAFKNALEEFKRKAQSHLEKFGELQSNAISIFAGENHQVVKTILGGSDNFDLLNQVGVKNFTTTFFPASQDLPTTGRELVEYLSKNKMIVKDDYGFEEISQLPENRCLLTNNASEITGKIAVVAFVAWNVGTQAMVALEGDKGTRHTEAKYQDVYSEMIAAITEEAERLVRQKRPDISLGSKEHKTLRDSFVLYELLKDLAQIEKFSSKL